MESLEQLLAQITTKRAQKAELENKLKDIKATSEFTTSEAGQKWANGQELLTKYPFYKLTQGASGYKDTGTFYGLWNLSRTYTHGSKPSIMVIRPIVPRNLNATTRITAISTNGGANSASNAIYSWAHQVGSNTKHVEMSNYHKQKPIGEVIKEQEDYLDANASLRAFYDKYYKRADFAHLENVTESANDCVDIGNAKAQELETQWNNALTTLTESLNADLEVLVSKKQEVQDKLNLSKEALATAQNELKALEAQNAENIAQIESLKTQAQEQEAQNTELQSQIQAKEAGINAQNAEIQSLRDSLDNTLSANLEAKEQELAQLQTQTQELQAQKAQKQKELQELEAQSAQNTQELNAITQEIAQISQNALALSQILSEQEAELNAQKAQIAQKEQQIAALNADILAMQNAQNTLISTDKDLSAQIALLELQKENLEDTLKLDTETNALLRLESLEQEIEVLKVQVEDKRIQQRALNAKIVEISNERVGVSLEVLDLNALSHKLRLKIQQADADNAKLLLDLAQAKLNVHILELREITLNAKVALLKDANKEAESEVNALKKEQEKLETRLEALEIQKELNAQVSAELNALLDTLEKQIAQKQQEIKDKETQAQELEAKLDEQKELLQKENENYVGILARLENLRKEIKVASDTRTLLNNAYYQIVGKIDLLSGKYSLITDEIDKVSTQLERLKHGN